MPHFKHPTFEDDVREFDSAEEAEALGWVKVTKAEEKALDADKPADPSKPAAKK